MTLAMDIARLLTRELDGFARELELFPEEAMLWHTAPGLTNSAGNLALHVAGNLQHFVGRMLGGTLYLRDRDAEFGTRGASRAAVLAELREAARAVRDTLDRLDVSTLEMPMPGAPPGLHTRTDLFLLHLVAHTAFHLGQAGYLRRLLTGNGASAEPLPLRVLDQRA